MGGVAKLNNFTWSNHFPSPFPAPGKNKETELVFNIKKLKVKYNNIKQQWRKTSDKWILIKSIKRTGLVQNFESDSFLSNP